MSILKNLVLVSLLSYISFGLAQAAEEGAQLKERLLGQIDRLEAKINGNNHKLNFRVDPDSLECVGQKSFTTPSLVGSCFFTASDLELGLKMAFSLSITDPLQEGVESDEDWLLLVLSTQVE